jgi:hypothetical protein
MIHITRLPNSPIAISLLLNLWTNISNDAGLSNLVEDAWIASAAAGALM